MTLQFLLPFDNFKLHTKLTMREVQARLADNIEPKKAYRFHLFNERVTKLYEGVIIGSSFEIRRIISYRNSFLPVIKGELSTHLDMTEISVRMRPFIFALIFISFWLCTLGSICIVLLPEAIRQFTEYGYSPTLHIPFIMFAFGYALPMIGYRIEAQKSKDILKAILEAVDHS